MMEIWHAAAGGLISPRGIAAARPLFSFCDLGQGLLASSISAIFFHRVPFLFFLLPSLYPLFFLFSSFFCLLSAPLSSLLSLLCSLLSALFSFSSLWRRRRKEKRKEKRREEERGEKTRRRERRENTFVQILELEGVLKTMFFFANSAIFWGPANCSKS